jgi:hypothetical protein
VGLTFPNYPEHLGGDEQTESPQKHQQSLLGSERGTQLSRRLETDASRNLYVRIAADDANLTSVSALAGGSAANVPANTLTTILTHTPGAAAKLTRISVSGQNYGKVQIFVNSVLIETKRMGPDRNVDFNWAVPFAVAASTPIDVKVTHFVTGELNDFEATIYGV